MVYLPRYGCWFHIADPIMYEAYFGLTEKPFSITPDPRFVYLSPRHEEALAHLRYGVGEGGGFVQLTGEVGTGKTTLCRCLLEQIHEAVDVALILNPRLTPVELVASICDELKVEYPAGSSSLKVLVDLLNARLLQSHAQGRKTVVVVDEAQDLEPAALEQIRLLTNLETAKDKLLQIILVGQPELRITLTRLELRQLAQRITARYHLMPLNREETRGYIAHRLAVAGSNRLLFAASAMAEIYRYSGGVPRLINILCDHALLAAYAANTPRVNARLVQLAASQIDGIKPRRRFWRPLAGGAGLAAAIGLAVTGFLWWAPAQQATDSTAPVGVGELDPSAVTAAGTSGTAPQPAAPAPGNPAVQTAATLTPPPAAPRLIAAAPAAPESALDSILTGPSPSFLEVDRADVDSDPSAPSPGLDHLEPDDSAEATASAAPARPTPAARTPLPEPRFSVWLRDHAPSTGSDTAFAALFRLWDIDEPPGPDRKLCAAAEDVGLRCMVHSGDWATLRRFDRPAVIELYDENGRQRQLTVAALTDDRVTFRVGPDLHAFPVIDVSPYWLGDFLVLWRVPTGLSGGLIKPGTWGNEVLWLRERLAAIRGQPIPAGTDPFRFDATLTQAVRAFQGSRSLQQDGIVGQKTFIHLNSALDEPGIPRLIQRQS
jgi:general secretion pathway protein A